MKKNKDEGRFITVYDDESGLSRNKIKVDTETGVNYLINIEGMSGGITVLLDKEGRPVVSQVKP